MQPPIFEDESLRDGLQSEKRILSLDEKLVVFRLLVEAGVKRIQVGSFVHPRLVPQMADTDELIGRVIDTDGVLLTGLVLNEKGLERAWQSGLKHVSMSVSVSDAHSRRNVRRSARESLKAMVGLIARAVECGLTVRAGAQCAFGCVYEGAVPEERVIDALSSMVEAGASELNLADTAGLANPLQVRGLVDKAVKTFPGQTVSLHLHDTRGLGLANMLAGYESGVEVFDVATGGLGGCPFVAGASGNVPAEDAVNLFEQMGMHTDIDLTGLCRVVEAYEKYLEKKLPGRMCRVLRSQGACD